MASQPAKLNKYENYIACITISTRNWKEYPKKKKKKEREFCSFKNINKLKGDKRNIHLSDQ